MTRKETILLMAVIKTAYPEYYRDQEYLEDAARLWHEMLKDENANIIGKAVKEFIKSDKKGYPPKIGQIVDIAREISLSEWRSNLHNLSEPSINAVTMPNEFREMMYNMLKRV